MTIEPLPRHSRQSLFARIWARGQDRDGQALVEFALVLPLILLLALGIIDMGRAINYKNDLTSLANQAARYAEVNACSSCSTVTPSTIANYIQNNADSNELAHGGGQITAPIAISYCWVAPVSTPPGNLGDALKVTATATYRWLPYLIAETGLPSTTKLTSSVTVRLATAWNNNINGLYAVPGNC